MGNWRPSQEVFLFDQISRDLVLELGFLVIFLYRLEVRGGEDLIGHVLIPKQNRKLGESLVGGYKCGKQKTLKRRGGDFLTALHPAHAQTQTRRES
jgi:hypothetical protein